MENTSGNTGEESPGTERPWPHLRAQTADPAVNAALASLGTLADTPIPEQHAVYTALHDGLLAELNAEPPEER
ncbi:hypothetical protein QNO08_05950 [Arthrobacter sp. zg-Y820]|uniref:hypothetical protein n=1 Tax=unclassified Arthrobacter TaxID=235627 RepID=UPI001E3F560F|nr:MULTISPECIES: hypothetical protein [unclassified Arthrobacter]MCC9197937.1 hypothetical protein [Arthrobacter sp. zg-Y820]MDK1280804.1 hypothetical protein [Arthrobacter sp. zg.Y820]MDK1360854.1 hypothetical protein [Arthrobacter sp. zg-Y1219]WIB10575.1 hypothetical protein QNO08_05950 [Arthrobacter sp. zg-Y820]